MNFDLGVTVPVFTVFIQGLLSFFSPCVLPIIPLYMGYIGGGAIKTDENGVKKYSQKTVIINTIFFIVGISFSFFLLGMGFSAFGRFFSGKQMLFSRIGGIIIILLGLSQIGILDKPFKGKEFKLPFKINLLKMNPLTALLMGFLFSFAWTPCVGPALSTVLIMVSSSSSTWAGLGLMGVYTIGFTLPFLLTGIFTTQCLNLFKKHSNVLKYTVKIGAVIMILMGVMMLTGKLNSITGYLNKVGNSTGGSTSSSETTESSETSSDESKETESHNNSSNETKDLLPAPDFELEDQFGNIHTLSDYKGKVIFLNFWATWCPPCKAEMPDIQKLYENYGLNEEDVIILGVASPKSDDNKYTQEQDKDYVVSFLKENNYTYPTLMDVTGDLSYSYGISAFPTTFMIDTDSNVYGYVSGMLSYDIMENIIKQTEDSKN